MLIALFVKYAHYAVRMPYTFYCNIPMCDKHILGALIYGTSMYENEMGFNYCLHLRRHVVTISVSERFHIFIGVASEHVYLQVYTNRFKWNK